MESFFSPKRVRWIATVVAILASLAVAANNAVQFFQHIQAPTIPVEDSSPPKPDNSNSASRADL